MTEKVKPEVVVLDNTDPSASAPTLEPANDPLITDACDGAGDFKPAPPTLDDTLDDDSPLPAPTVTNDMYYGLTGEVMREASDGSEVHPAAVGIGFLCLAGAALGRGRFLRVGNDLHHARVYCVHVGRSGIGGKGMALGLTKAIRAALEQGADPRYPISGYYHDGGLSSREGLAWAIRDPSDDLDKDGEPIDAGVSDKRLFVLEEEFANVLAQSKRDGNTLSSALRTAWDGGDIAPLTKTNRTRATRPHIGIHACITPSELVKSLATRDLTNGFANRFLYVWAERQGFVPYPRSSPHDTVAGLAKKLKEAIAFSKFGGELHASEDARDEFALYYYRNRKGLGLSECVRGLTERHPPYAWRLAMIFALLDCSDTIAKPHMQTAIAWLRYCAASVARIFSTIEQHTDAAEAGDLVPRILESLQQAGGHLDHVGLHAALGKPNAKILKLALTQAEMASVLEVTVERRKGGGRPRRSYTLKTGKRFGQLAPFGSGAGDADVRCSRTSPQFGSARDGLEAQIAAMCTNRDTVEIVAPSQTAQIAQTAGSALS